MILEQMIIKNIEKLLFFKIKKMITHGFKQIKSNKLLLIKYKTNISDNISLKKSLFIFSCIII